MTTDPTRQPTASQERLAAPTSVGQALALLLESTNAKSLLAGQIATQENFVAQQWATAYFGAQHEERTATGRNDMATASTAVVRMELTRLRGEMIAVNAKIDFLTTYINAYS